MKIHLRIASLLALLALLGLPVSAAEIGFIEEFALAEDRASVLAQLIPGTDEYYYYHGLHFEHSQNADAWNDNMKKWAARLKQQSRSEPSSMKELRNRHALLHFGDSPKSAEAAWTRIIDELNLRFNHTRQVSRKPDFPTSLDQKRIATAVYKKRAMGYGDAMNRFTPWGLDLLQGDNLSADHRRALLSRLERPDWPGLVDLIALDLKYRNSGGFGSHGIHSRLTLEQLKALAKKQPELLRNGAFVNEHIKRLSPNADVDLDVDLDQRVAALDRIWDFVEPLDPVHNSLKLNTLYERLRLDLERGQIDEARFLEYVKIPRNLAYMEPRWINRDEHRHRWAKLNQNFPSPCLSPVRGDEGLLREYLERFFIDAKDYKKYAPYLRDPFLKEIFASTKILHGKGDVEKWASMLSPSVYRNLKESVEINFRPENPKFIGPKDLVKLAVDIKNVPELLVKVYEVNSFNYFREMGMPVNLAINLDGLVATSEETKTFGANARSNRTPERRITETFSFPQLKGRGVWVVEFIGNGFSSRALVQKGRLHVETRSTSAGHGFLVLDEDQKPVKTATAWIGGREFETDKNGIVIVPYSTSPKTEKLILRDGDFASLVSFPHKAESYALQCGMHVDHEALQHEGDCEVVLRPVLTLNGVPVNPKLIEKPRLIITSTDLEGTSSQREIGGLAFDIGEELVVPFKVPRDLRSLNIVVQGEVENITANRRDKVRHGENFQLNQIDETSTTEAINFTRIGDDYLIDVRGRNGEAVANRPLNIEVQHKWFTQHIDVLLQTDEKGSTNLGPLDNIQWVRVRGANLREKTLVPEEASLEIPTSIHGYAGEQTPIALPAIDAMRVEDLSLFSLRSGEYFADHRAELKGGKGFVILPPLEPGDYELTLKAHGMQRIPVRISEGQTRRLEFINPAPLQISEIDTNDKTVKIKLANAGEHTRLHVFATWYQPAWNPFVGLLDSRSPHQSVQDLVPVRSFYESGRDIGDEYRYILDRQTAERFAGNMLKRPGLLLNPWEVRETEATDQDAKEGGNYTVAMDDLVTANEAPAKKSKAKANKAGQSRGRRSQSINGLAWANVSDREGRDAGGEGVHPDINYLAEPSVRLLNLKPDTNGVITVKIDELKGKPQVHIVAVDPLNTVYRPFYLDEGKLDLEDLRLRRGLDPKKGYAEQKLTSVMAGDGKPFTIRDGRTATFAIYDSLAGVFGLMQTLSGNPTLDEFRFVLKWPDMNEAEKRSAYSKFACHELSFFLYHKDRPFFERVIKPYLANKKDQTFMDHWLLESPLDTYLEPWAFQRLNHVEKILLAGRRPGGSASTARWIKDRFDLIPPDIDGDNGRFLAGINSGALGAGGENAEQLERLGALLGSISSLELEESEMLMDERSDSDMDGVVTKYAGRSSRDKAAEGGGGATFGFSTGGFAAPGAAAPASTPVAGESLRMLGEAKQQAEKQLDQSIMVSGKLSEAKSKRSNLAIEKNFGDLRKSVRDETRRFFVKLEKTKEWAENNYYQLRIQQQTGDLVAVDAFWNDYAAHQAGGGNAPFVSPHISKPAQNFTAMMLALAVLDLPFDGGSLDQAELKDGDIELTFNKPAILFHQEIRESEEAADKTPILVAQNFFRADDRYRNENNERFDKFVRDEFLRGVVYGTQVILTNPNSSRQKLDAMLQIPRGAIPVQRGFQTRGFDVVLEPFGTRTLEYYFYFPASGSFEHFPVNVARNEELVARAEATTFKVVDEPSDVDETSWAWISQNADEDRLFDYLDQANLNRIDLNQMVWRLKDKAFFERALERLTDRLHYHQTVWQYAVYHRDVARSQTFLKHTGFPEQCGRWLDSPLLEIDPVLRHRYEHLEYDPLVNRRAHQLGRRRHIANHALHQQYHELLSVLSYRPAFDDTDHLAVSYYLALQDRTGEALDHFGKVDRGAVSTQLQYDYMAAWFAITQEDATTARELAGPYLEHPVDKWRSKFVALANQLDEKPELADDENRDESQDLLAGTEPVMHVSVIDREVEIDHQNLGGAVVNLYPMDIELLFSRNPFVKDQSATFTFVKPAFTQKLPFAEEENKTRFAIPQKFRNRNVMVELVAGGVKDSAAVYANDLTVSPIENYGHVQVLHQDTAKPLSKTYVKVYARLGNGQIKFFKDGYTDFRGRFDYVSLNSETLNDVQRFSILVLHPEFGATILETEPPKR